MICLSSSIAAVTKQNLIQIKYALSIFIDLLSNLLIYLCIYLFVCLFCCLFVCSFVYLTIHSTIFINGCIGVGYID